MTNYVFLFVFFYFRLVGLSSTKIDVLVANNFDVTDVMNYVISSRVNDKPEVRIKSYDRSAILNATSVCNLVDNSTNGFIIVTSCEDIWFFNHITGKLQLPVFYIPTTPCSANPVSATAYVIQPYLHDMLLVAIHDILIVSGFTQIAVLYDEYYDLGMIDTFFKDISLRYVTTLSTQISTVIDDVILNEWLEGLDNSTDCIVLMVTPSNIPLVIQKLKFSHFHNIIVQEELDVRVYHSSDKIPTCGIILTSWIPDHNTNNFRSDFVNVRLEYSLNLLLNLQPEINNLNEIVDCSTEKAVPAYSNKIQTYMTKNGFDETRYKTDAKLYITKFPRITETVGEWSRTTRLNLTDADLFDQEDAGFGNVTLIVGTLPAEPFTIKLANGEYVGFCIDILNELAYRLKFRYTIREPGDGQWGAPSPDGTWNGLVRQTKDGNFDMSIGPISLTSEREEVIDFTTPIMEDGAGIILRKFEDIYGKIFRSFKPFTTNVWITIGCVLLGVGLVLGLVDKFSPFRGKTGEISVNGEKKTSICDDIWIVYGSYMEQGAEFTPANASGRFILGFWWIFTILIISSYTASLAAFLTVAFYDKPIKTVDDLAAQTEIKPLVKQGSNLYSLLQKGETERYRKLYQLMLQAPEVYTHDQAIQLVTTGSYAYLSDDSQLEFLRKSDCEHLILGEEPFNVGGMGFIVGQDSPLLDQLSYNIIKLQEAGLIRKWRQKWWTSTNTCTESTVTNVVQSLELDSTSGPFIAFAGTTIISFLCLVLEHLYFRCKCVKRATLPRNNTVSFNTATD